MGIPPYLPPEKSVCRSRSNKLGKKKKQQVRTGHGTTDWFKIWERKKGLKKGEMDKGG